MNSKITKFEKVSLSEWKKYDNLGLNYDDIKLPIRATSDSAGYDFFAPYALKIKPGETEVLHSGIKCSLESDQVLLLVPRSSVGIKHNVILANTVGVIDSDYYGNKDNEGHIAIALTNLSKKNFNCKKGDRIVQGVIIKYCTTADDNSTNTRIGGVGSTGN